MHTDNLKRKNRKRAAAVRALWRPGIEIPLLLGMIVATLLVISPAMAQDGEAKLRMVHLSPDAPAVMVELDGEPVEALANVSYKDATPYLPIPAGQHDIAVYAVADPSKPVLEVSVMPEAGEAYTIAGVGLLANGTFGVKMFEDDISPPEEGKTKVRVVHAIPDVGAATVSVEGGPDLFSLPGFANASNYAEVDPGTYTLEVTPAGAEEPAFTVPDVEVEAGEVYTGFAVGQASEGTIGTLMTVDSDDGRVVGPQMLQDTSGDLSLLEDQKEGSDAAPKAQNASTKNPSSEDDKDDESESGKGESGEGNTSDSSKEEDRKQTSNSSAQNEEQVKDVSGSSDGEAGERAPDSSAANDEPEEEPQAQSTPNPVPTEATEEQTRNVSASASAPTPAPAAVETYQASAPVVETYQAPAPVFEEAIPVASTYTEGVPQPLSNSVPSVPQQPDVVAAPAPATPVPATVPPVAVTVSPAPVEIPVVTVEAPPVVVEVPPVIVEVPPVPDPGTWVSEPVVATSGFVAPVQPAVQPAAMTEDVSQAVSQQIGDMGGADVQVPSDTVTGLVINTPTIVNSGARRKFVKIKKLSNSR